MLTGLLMLATLLVYAAPSHAGPVSHGHPTAQRTFIAAEIPDDGAAAADHQQQQPSCDGPGLLDNGTCCSLGQCAAMHGGLLAGVTVAFRGPADEANRPTTLPAPEGIGIDPALRPPSD
jgi:hypothetical protein